MGFSSLHSSLTYLWFLGLDFRYGALEIKIFPHANVTQTSTLVVPKGLQITRQTSQRSTMEETFPTSRGVSE